MKKIVFLLILFVFSTSLFSQDQNTGYTGRINLGYGLGVGNWGKDRIKFDVINGYQFNEYFSIGGGLGYRYYTESKGSIFPIFLNIEAALPKNKIKPFITTSLGYSFDPTTYFDLGEYAETSDLFMKVGGFLDVLLGVKFEITDKTDFMMGFGFEIQQIKHDNYLVYTTNSGTALAAYGNGDFYNDMVGRNTGIVSFNVGINF